MKTYNLQTAARTAVTSCLGLQAGDRFLLVTNPDTEQAVIAEALRTEAEALGAATTLLVQPEKGQMDFAEPDVLDALESGPDAFASISSKKLGKDFRRVSSPLVGPDGVSYDHIFDYLLRGVRSMRAFWSPGAGLESFARTVDIDYPMLQSRAGDFAAMLQNAKCVKVTAPGGTDVLVPIHRRNVHRDDGDFRQAGRGGNLPAGEVFVSPQINSVEGMIVFDGSIAVAGGDIPISTPIRCAVQGGFVLECAGAEEARLLEATLRSGMEKAAELGRSGAMDPNEALRYASNSRHIGEFGIGLNSRARLDGRMLEAEKTYGTCHFAIGYNYDGDAPSLIHLDGLVKNPDIVVILEDGQEISLMKAGRAATVPHFH